MITEMIWGTCREEFYESKLVRMYQECFAEPPWYEVFPNGQLWQWFDDTLRLPGCLAMVHWTGQEPSGALVAFPLIHKPDVAEILASRCKPEECLYIAEVFVDKRFRRHGIGTALQGLALKLAKEDGFHYVSERTNFNSKMFPLIQKTGFETVAEQQVSSEKIIRGRRMMRSDKRGIFLLEL